jgi:hypothetical protein
LCGGASVKGLAAAPETDVWLRLARGARASAGLDSPVDPFAHEESAYVSLVHRAHAIAAMTAAARPSSRRDKAERRLPTEAADLTPGPGGPRHLGIVGEDLVGFRFAGCAFRSCSAPRGHVALEAASALGGETGAEHALRLCAQELGPAGADPARCRPEAGDAQHGRDRGRGDVDSELQQLASHIVPRQRGGRKSPSTEGLHDLDSTMLEPICKYTHEERRQKRR